MMSPQYRSSATTSSSPPRLDSSTRNLLDDFLDQKKKEKALFKQLKSRASSTSTSNTKRNDSSSVSSMSSRSGKRRNKHKQNDAAGRNVLDLLPRGRSARGSSGEEEDEDEASLLAQAEALADLERLNGVEPSIPIAVLRVYESDDDNSSDEDEGDNLDAPDENQPHEMDVERFRTCFGELWQLSQFWYSSKFSYHLARCLYVLLGNERSDSRIPNMGEKPTGTALEESELRTTTKKIGFICSPTAYVAFRYLYPEMSLQPDKAKTGIKVDSYLFDYDVRFSLLAPPQHSLPDPRTSDRFVRYDVNKPLVFPHALEEQLDMVVIDPPYLKAQTNLNIAKTVKKLLRNNEEGKILLITGHSIAEQACEIYGNDKTGSLRRAEKLEVDHVGLKNDFGAWGNWDGVETFGARD